MVFRPQKPRLYIVCRFEGYDNERILSLSRIQKAQVTQDNFVYPKNFDLAQYDGEGRFAFGEGHKVSLSFCIKKLVGQHLKESPLSDDQKLDDRDDHFLIQATVTDSMLLHSWLRGLGEDIWSVNIEPIKKN